MVEARQREWEKYSSIFFSIDIQSENANCGAFFSIYRCCLLVFFEINRKMFGFFQVQQLYLCEVEGSTYVPMLSAMSRTKVKVPVIIIVMGIVVRTQCDT